MNVYKNIKNNIWLVIIIICSLLIVYGCYPKDEDFFTTFGSDETQYYTLTFSVIGTGTGSVMSDPHGIECPDDCEEEYPEGTEVNIFTTLGSNSLLESYGGDCVGAEGPEITVTMTGPINCTVTFTLIEEEDPLLTIGHYFTSITGIENGFYFNGITDYNDFQKYSHSKQQNEVFFGDLSGYFITGFAGENGYQVLDLATGEVLKEVSNLGDTGPFFGIAGASQDPPGADNPVMIALAGANGFVLDRLDQEGPAEFGTTTFDFYPAGGSPNTDVITHVLPGAGVGFIVFDDAQNRYVPAEVGFPLNLFGDVQLISAYMHDDVLSDDPVPQPRGNFLVLSRETESGVFLVTWDGTDPVRAIDNIGFDARRLRCIDNGTDSGTLVCAASIFGHDRLGLMTWDGENVPVLTDFAEIGDGPVGIDLRLLPNGNIGIASTGFNDNTVTETIVSPNGIVDSNNTRNVLDGCVSPGHAIYIEDSEDLKIIGTCYNSNSYFIVESEL